MITARLRELIKELGRSLDDSEGDCRSVIAIKVREWINDETNTKYLRHATLFNKTKFWQYHGELIRLPTEADNDLS